jgi:predicted HTH domain antitoxin
MAPLKVEIELLRDLLAAQDIPEADLGQRAKEWIVLELFQEGEISAGKAGEILGLSKSSFLGLLTSHHLPYVDADPQELEKEVATAQAARHPARG